MVCIGNDKHRLGPKLECDKLHINLNLPFNSYHHQGGDFVREEIEHLDSPIQ